MRQRTDIGLKIQDVKIGKRVYYYSWVNDHENPEGRPAVITGEVREVCGTLCCNIDIISSVVALSNLSEENVPAKRLTAQKRRPKARYQRFLELDGCWTDDFGEYIRCGMYKYVDD